MVGGVPETAKLPSVVKLLPLNTFQFEPRPVVRLKSSEKSEPPLPPLHAELVQVWPEWVVERPSLFEMYLRGV